MLAFLLIMLVPVLVMLLICSRILP